MRSSTSSFLPLPVSSTPSLLQALDLHAHQLIAQRVHELHDPNDHSLKKLHTEAKQKLADVRGRGAALYREWFFHNPISHLRECDGDRCEFWRFRYPLQALQEQEGNDRRAKELEDLKIYTHNRVVVVKSGEAGAECDPRVLVRKRSSSSPSRRSIASSAAHGAFC